jgi:hypothetical protein
VLLHLEAPLRRPRPGRTLRPLPPAQSSPNATRTEVVGKIIYLRQHYHFGPAKIAMYLQRYHDIQISNSGVWRILKRHEAGRCVVGVAQVTTW